MVPAALIPTLAMMCGVASSIAWPVSWHLLVWLVAPMPVAASVAWWLRHDRLTAGLILAGFACCGAILGAHAREQAIDAPLRTALDAAVGGYRVGDRRLPPARGPIDARMQLTEDASFDDEGATI